MVTVNPSESQISVRVELSSPQNDQSTSSIVLLHPKTKLEGLSSVLKPLLEVQHDYDIESSMQPDYPRLIVSEGKSTYDPKSDESLLRINADQRLVDYFKEYRSFHGLNQKINNESKATIKSDNPSRFGSSRMGSSVQMGPASITFHRTLRVPDDNKHSALPPSLGAFPLERANRYHDTLPEALKARGGVLLPIMQREAMWISFASSEQCALKISVGGVNAITGRPRDKAPPSNAQDYVSLPVQPWIDGICTEPGVVRQFVAMPLGHGYTVEEQVTGRADLGGLQIDMFPSFNQVVAFESELGVGQTLDIAQSPRQLSIPTGKYIKMNTKSAPCVTLEDYVNRVSARPVVDVRSGPAPLRVFVAEPSGKRHSVAVSPSTTVAELKALVPGYNHTYEVRYDGHVIGFEIGRDRSATLDSRSDTATQPELQNKHMNEVTLGECKIPTNALLQFSYPVYNTLTSARMSSFGGSSSRSRGGGGPPPSAPMMMKKGRGVMGMAAGGQIEQRIYPDPNPAIIYDEENAERLWVHTLSSDAWEDITGVLPPVSPVTRSTYASYRYPWFKLYDELRGIPSTGAFDKVQSVKMLDDSKATELTPDGVNLFNPDAPPPCTSHRDTISTCVFRPCSHTACEACIDKATASAKCPNCDEMIYSFVGYKKPIKVNVGAGSAGNWKYVEDHIDAPEVSDVDVITLILVGDNVVRLHNGGR